MFTSFLAFTILSSQTPRLTECAGFYAYIPHANAPADRGVAFTVEVQPTAVEVLFSDNGSVFGRKQVREDGAVEFNEGRGDPLWRLECQGEQATLTIPADEYTPARGFALTRSETNVHEMDREEATSE